MYNKDIFNADQFEICLYIEHEDEAFDIWTLEKTEGATKNGQFRDTMDITKS